MQRDLRISVVHADALHFAVDVLVLKFATALHGLDKAAVSALAAQGILVRLPSLGKSTLVKTKGAIAPNQILLQGVKPLHQFEYTEIRDFIRSAIETAAVKAPSIQSIALTIHGPGYGLDEIEAFESALAGVIDSVNAGNIPNELERITFVENNSGRATRLSQALSRILPGNLLKLGNRNALTQLGAQAQSTLRTAGYSSLSKSHVFVAMPFAKEMDDIFHYGIQGAVNAQGLLCERADLAIFTGDIVDWVKTRILDASLVIADLSTANANVYLEVGYAWGCQVPTILLASNASELKFDVRGQRCLIYDSIKNLDEKLRKELSALLGANEAKSAHAGAL
jgi:hypothetical protein